MYSKPWLMIILSCTSIALFGQTEQKISLAEALKTAVERNLDIQLQRVTIESQSLNFDLTRAAYEPTVTSQFQTSKADREPQDILDGSSSYSETSDSFFAEYRKGYDFGFGYNVRLSSRVDNSGSARQRTGDIFGSSLSLGFQQQLLRGFSFSQKEVYQRDQLVAQRDIAISEADLKTQISTVIQQTENAYWDLVFAQEQLKVAQQSLNLAKQLYDQNKIKIDVGTLAPIELVNTEATVANRERDIIDAENRVRAAEDALKKVMNLPFGEWKKTLVPTEMLNINELPINEDQAYSLARSSRPELQKTDYQIQKAQLDITYNENQLKPELRLSGSYTGAGNDYPFNRPLDPEDPDGPSELVDSKYSRAIEEAYGFDFPTYNIQLDLTWSPFNKQAKINLARSKVALRQAELQTQQTEINIMEEVRAAIRDLEANLKAIRASEKSVRFQEENLKAEEQKFQNGLVTNYRVSEAQDQLAQARSTLIQSKVNYLKAVVSYYKAIGNLTKERQIAVQ